HHLDTPQDLGFVDQNGDYLDRAQARDVTQQARAKNVIDTNLKSGATPTQAVESTRLATQTPVVDGATTDQNVLREKGQQIATTTPISFDRTSILQGLARKMQDEAHGQAVLHDAEAR